MVFELERFQTTPDIDEDDDDDFALCSTFLIPLLCTAAVPAQDVGRENTAEGTSRVENRSVCFVSILAQPPYPFRQGSQLLIASTLWKGKERGSELLCTRAENEAISLVIESMHLPM